MTPIKTKSGDILLMVVPSDACSFNIYRDEISGRQYVMYAYRNAGIPDADKTPLLPEGDWKLLGEITHKREFSFDIEPFVEPNVWADMVSAGHDYSGGNGMRYLKPEDAFISMIEAHGEILWSNPIEPPCLDDYDMEETDMYCEKLRLWQSNEDRVIKPTQKVIVLGNPNK